MKTKHLLFAAALPLAFAACQNEEFESANSPELSNDQRPLVEVNLNFQKGEANTRVDYDGTKYTWTADDKIGAFLMDEIASTNRPFGPTADDWAKETWLQHYELVDYIHTDYPFSWNAKSNAWEAPSKLQEGNYFFACPYETYEGKRQLIHYIDGQKQTGGTVADMNAAIAKNQYFIGYAQVQAGTENKEALKDVIMAPVLAPIKVTLRNIGTVAKDIEKIIIRGKKVATALTVNPTDATYGGTDSDGFIKDGQVYNLGTAGSSVGSSDTFNYANLIGATEDVHTVASDMPVYNIASGATDYKQGDALRQIVKTSYSAVTEIPSYEKQAMLTFTEPVKVAGNNGEIHFAVMVNTIPEIQPGEGVLTMDIITTQGQITNIDLTEKKEAETTGGLKPNTVLTNNAIKSLKPSVKNELIIQFDNNSVVKAQELEVQDGEQLMAFINWNAENARVNTATLIKDVKFTKEMYDALKAASYKGKLAIVGTEGKLLVDNDVPTDVLNLLDASTSAVIVLNGERAMTNKIAEDLKDADAKLMTIENQGTLTIAEEVVAYVELNNYGTIAVTEDGILKGTMANNITNYGMLENKGEIYNVVNDVDDDAKGWIKTSGKVNHIVSNEAGATIQLTSAGDKITGMTTQNGTIYLETATGVTAKVLNDQNVTKLKVTGGIIDFNNADNSTVKELTISGNVKIEGWDDSNPRKSAYHEFSGVDKATISGTVSFTNAGIDGSSATIADKDAALTFDKNVNFNDITFVKGATVKVLEKGNVEVVNVVWNNNNLDNLGKFVYVTSTTGTVNVIAGNEPTPKPTPTPVEDDKFVAEISGADSYEGVAPNAQRTFASVARLKKYMDDGVDGRNLIITKIVISTQPLALNSDNAADFKSLTDGKDVELSTTLSGLAPNMNISFKSLTTTDAAVVEGTATTNKTILKVGKLDFSGANLTITDGYIQMPNSAQPGTGCNEITNGSTLNGTIVAQELGAVAGTFVKWNNTTNTWEKIN